MFLQLGGVKILLTLYPTFLPKIIFVTFGVFVILILDLKSQIIIKRFPKIFNGRIVFGKKTALAKGNIEIFFGSLFTIIKFKNYDNIEPAIWSIIDLEQMKVHNLSTD